MFKQALEQFVAEVRASLPEGSRGGVLEYDGLHVEGVYKEPRIVKSH